MSSLYLHIPYCEHKCIYCDFYSIESLSSTDSFLSALRREIAMYGGVGENERFETVFFGGGTPSLLAPETIGGLLELLYKTFAVESNAEITLESNPGTVDRAKLEGYRAAGINRLSFGVQSFHDDDLKFLTRIHSSKQARQAVRLAKESGFNNINVDLIFSLPGQTMQRWEENLREAVALETPHISAYSLIVEKGTPLGHMVSAKQIAPLPVEEEADMYEFTMQYLHAAGFEHYEVSNYAKPGFRSIHNNNYWNHSNYLGFGPSAHSFREGRRWWNVRSIEAYCEKLSANTLPVAGEEFLTHDQRVEEVVMLGLRSAGIDLPGLAVDFGVDLTALEGPMIGHLLRDGLAELVEDRLLRLTDKGFLLCDEIARRLLSNVHPVPVTPE